MRQTRRITIGALLLAFAATGDGCGGDSGNGPPGGSGGKVGSGGSSATGGEAGSGGALGSGTGGHGGKPDTGGTTGTGGATPTGGRAAGGGATAGRGGAGGSGDAGGRGGKGGAPGTGASGGASPMGGKSGSNPETGRLIGITAAHNAVRAAVQTTTALPPLAWSETLAQYAQQWVDSLAATSCSSPHHRSSQDLDKVGYGENLYVSLSSVGSSTAQQAVDAWAAEKACYTYGNFMTNDKCDTTCYTKLNSDGCGHYTQIVWRTSTEVGCGVATCTNGGAKEDIWICNYKPPGNYIGNKPY